VLSGSGSLIDVGTAGDSSRKPRYHTTKAHGDTTDRLDGRFHRSGKLCDIPLNGGVESVFVFTDRNLSIFRKNGMFADEKARRIGWISSHPALKGLSNAD
jgi:phosphomevalonate kinase